jgi:DNA-binding transcriptional MerR regulator
MERAHEIVRLRKLGLGLAEIGQLLEADTATHSALLSSHETRLAMRKQELDAALRALNRERLGPRSIADERMETGPIVAFDLPWPWDGERFELALSSPLTFITGPLGSGKTRLAMALAQALPNGCFLGLDRPAALTGHSRPDEQALCRQVLERFGATPSRTLTVLVEAIYTGPPGPLVVDMVEQDLDHATQETLMDVLRHKFPERALFLMTRSSAILDLSKIESGETIIYCPANHSPPIVVRADAGYPGYEAVAMCLASPDVRARTAGTVTMRSTPPPGSRDSRETFC